ncbi:MAG: Dihydrofolate reductase, partial [uncultured Thermomicrobiales bacterium]
VAGDRGHDDVAGRLCQRPERRGGSPLSGLGGDAAVRASASGDPIDGGGGDGPPLLRDGQRRLHGLRVSGAALCPHPPGPRTGSEGSERPADLHLRHRGDRARGRSGEGRRGRPRRDGRRRCRHHPPVHRGRSGGRVAHRPPLGPPRRRSPVVRPFGQPADRPGVDRGERVAGRHAPAVSREAL